MKVRFSRRATDDLGEILAALFHQSPQAAGRLLTRIEKIVARLSRFPGMAQELAEREGVRKVPLVRFPYLIFYKVVGDEVVILHIVHGARREPWENL